MWWRPRIEARQAARLLRRLGRASLRGPLLTACCLAAAFSSAPPALGSTTPQVTGVGPNNGPEAGGNTITVRGAGFLNSSPVRTVTFGGRPSPNVTIASESLLTAVTPPGAGEAEVRVSNSRGESSPAVPGDNYAYDPAPAGPWLGLNGNSSRFLGPIDSYVERGVVFDRSGPIEWRAGETLKDGGSGLALSMAAGMIPVVTIEFKGYSDCTFGQSECLPRSDGAIHEYVRGFLKSAAEMLAKYPAAGILLEPINEPWGYGTPEQYAAILAQLLPEAARAHLPMAQIYAGATDKGWVGALYAARPQLRSEVKGWYMHPYTSTRAPGTGVSSLPAVQAEMTSGQNNVIISELGFCAPDVNKAAALCATSAAPTRDSSDAANALTGELQAALPYHRAGWLRALLVYSRNDRGWAMQLTGGALTRQGAALQGFAEANG